MGNNDNSISLSEVKLTIYYNYIAFFLFNFEVFNVLKGSLGFRVDFLIY